MDARRPDKTRKNRRVRNAGVVKKRRAAPKRARKANPVGAAKHLIQQVSLPPATWTPPTAAARAALREFAVHNRTLPSGSKKRVGVPRIVQFLWDVYRIRVGASTVARYMHTI
jgi:hypothetical protein